MTSILHAATTPHPALPQPRAGKELDYALDRFSAVHAGNTLVRP